VTLHPRWPQQQSAEAKTCPAMTLHVHAFLKLTC